MSRWLCSGSTSPIAACSEYHRHTDPKGCSCKHIRGQKEPEAAVDPCRETVFYDVYAELHHIFNELGSHAVSNHVSGVPWAVRQLL